MDIIEQKIQKLESLAENYTKKRIQRAFDKVQQSCFSEWQKATQAFFLEYLGRDHIYYKKIRCLTADKNTLTLSNEFDKFQPICTEVYTLARKKIKQIGIEPKNFQSSNKVFIVHGHDKTMKTAVKKYIVSLGLKPIILSERANRNMTILEKLQNEAKDIGFAVVLYTPCDEGREFGSNTGLTRRARENVVLELGYFSALLPKKVAILLKRPKNVSFDFPNDFKGIGYIEYPKPDWKEKLKEEFKAAHILS